MSRSLLALCILFFASSAMANNVSAGTDPVENGVKPGKSTAVGSGQDSETTPASQPSAPARTSIPRPSSPRWHTMLPGMIR